MNSVVLAVMINFFIKTWYVTSAMQIVKLAMVLYTLSVIPVFQENISWRGTLQEFAKNAQKKIILLIINQICV